MSGRSAAGPAPRPQMSPSPVLYSQRSAPCGCRGVPTGQHLPGCPHCASGEAPRCERCGLRARTEAGRCGICGARRLPPPIKAPLQLLSAEELEHAFGPGIDRPERLEWLRTDEREGIRVDLWDTGERPPNGHPQLAYRLCVAEGTRWVLIFSGEEFGGSPLHAVDSNDTLGAILAFLSLRPGDTDATYFERYTPRQLEFAEQHGDGLAMWSSELEGAGEGERDG